MIADEKPMITCDVNSAAAYNRTMPSANRVNTRDIFVARPSAARGDAGPLAAVGRAGASLRAAVRPARGERRGHVAKFSVGLPARRAVVEHLERRGLLSADVGAGTSELAGAGSVRPVVA